MRADGEVSEGQEQQREQSPPPPAAGILVRPGALYRRAVYALDARLRRIHDVFEFSRDPRCILRAQAVVSDRPVRLGDGVSVATGDRFLDLHIWSEHVPKVARGGAGFAWARQMRADFELSLRELAGWLTTAPEFADIAVLRASLNFTTPDDTGPARVLLRRFGFEEIPDDRPLSAGARLHRFGENIWLGLLVLASNPRTFRWNVLRRDRVMTYLSRGRLLQRYGAAKVDA